MPRPPTEFSDAGRPPAATVEVVDEAGRAVPLMVAAEQSLTLVLDGREIATLATAGATPEDLVVGYLRRCGLVDELDALASVRVDADTGTAVATTRGAGTAPRVAVPRAVRLDPRARLTEATLLALVERLGGTRAADAPALVEVALCANAGERRGQVLLQRQDLDARLATDAVAGRMWRDGLAGDDAVLWVGAPVAADIVEACAAIGVPFLVSPWGPTAMAHAMATRTGLTLLTHCLRGTWRLCTGAGRFVSERAATRFA